NLELLAAFGSELRIAEGSRHETRLVFVADRGVIKLRRVERPRLRAGGAKRETKAKAVHDGHVKPRLFTYHPRTAELRIIGGFELLAERAVVVATQRNCQKCAIAPRDLLLAEHADRRVGAVVLCAAARRAASNRRDRDRREVRRSRADGAEVLMVVLQAHR